MFVDVLRRRPIQLIKTIKCTKIRYAIKKNHYSASTSVPFQFCILFRPVLPLPVLPFCLSVFVLSFSYHRPVPYIGCQTATKRQRQGPRRPATRSSTSPHIGNAAQRARPSATVISATGANPGRRPSMPTRLPDYRQRLAAHCAQYSRQQTSQ